MRPLTGGFSKRLFKALVIYTQISGVKKFPQERIKLWSRITPYAFSPSFLIDFSVLTVFMQQTAISIMAFNACGDPMMIWLP